VAPVRAGAVSALPWPHAKAAKVSPRRLAVALCLRGGVLRRAVSNVAVPALPWDARSQ
jgi:hypothetical protein